MAGWCRPLQYGESSTLATVAAPAGDRNRRRASVCGQAAHHRPAASSSGVPSASATLRAIVDDVPPPLAVAGGVSAARAIRLAAYFADALSKNIERRPATAAAAADALRALML